MNKKLRKERLIGLSRFCQTSAAPPIQKQYEKCTPGKRGCLYQRGETKPQIALLCLNQDGDGDLCAMSTAPIRTQPAGPSQGMLETHRAAEAALMAITTGSPPSSSACTEATTCAVRCRDDGTNTRFNVALASHEVRASRQYQAKKLQETRG